VIVEGGRDHRACLLAPKFGEALITWVGSETRRNRLSVHKLSLQARSRIGCCTNDKSPARNARIRA
jgi:hypothetical protein